MSGKKASGEEKAQHRDAHLCYRCLHLNICKIAAQSVNEPGAYAFLTIAECEEFLDELSLADMLKNQDLKVPLPDYDEVLTAVTKIMRNAESAGHAANGILVALGYYKEDSEGVSDEPDERS